MLVTGAAGFVGSHCVRELHARGHQPVGLVRQYSATSRLADLEDSVELLEVSLVDPVAVSSVMVKVAPDAVINAAWYTEPRKYLHDVDQNIESLGAGLTLLRAALEAGVRRVVLVGSCLEGVEMGPETIYARTKRCLHDVALTPAIQSRTAAVCAHVFSPYGPGEHSGRAVPAIVQALLNGEPIAVGTGTAQRDYIHVADVARALAVLAETSQCGTVDICTGRTVRLRELFELIASELQRPDLLRWGQAEVGPGESFDVMGDPSVLNRLGWRPEFSLEQGIRDTVGWWRYQNATTGGTH